MSWWIRLDLDGKVAAVDSFTEGGMYTLGGSDDAELNVTYNYGRLLNECGLHPDKTLNGRRAGDLIEMMEKARVMLDEPPDKDYWKPTRGNVAVVIRRLLLWARQYPDGVWRVS